MSTGPHSYQLPLCHISQSGASLHTCDQCFIGFRNVSNHFKHTQVTPLLRKPRPLTFLSRHLHSCLRLSKGQFSNRSQNSSHGMTSLIQNSCALRLHLSVTEAPRAARAAAQSSVLILLDQSAAFDTVLILLDLSAGFDTVNHCFLLSILSDMGVPGKAISWFESYVTGRFYFNVSWQRQTSISHHFSTEGDPRLSAGPPSLCNILHPLGSDYPHG